MLQGWTARIKPRAPHLASAVVGRVAKASKPKLVRVQAVEVSQGFG